MNARIRRYVWFVVVCLAVISCLSATFLEAQQTYRPRRGSAAIGAGQHPSNAPALTSEQPVRLREGAVITNQVGVFKTTGDSVTFVPVAGDSSFQMLENLALERVWRMFEQARGRQWSVSGVVTEYRGANYLLITRAVLRVHGLEPEASL